MSINFRLAYRNPVEYVDLFPKINIKDIEGLENNCILNFIEVDIPVFNDIIQNISIDINEDLINKNVEMYLISGSQDDYETITQFQIVKNAIILTRIYDYPKNSVKVALVFYNTGG